jgi:molybdopterin molybdotransferase
VTGLPWPTARACAHAAAGPLAPVELPLAACLGATLAAPLVARTPLPGFDTAALDGYAVRGGGPWRVAGQRHAGAVDAADRPAGRAAGRAADRPADRPADKATLAPGEAVEIATGAVVPRGAEAVLPYEEATRHGAALRGTVVPGRHIRRAGEDWAAGTALVEGGAHVTPAVLGVASSAGHDVLTVRPRPRVAALITGNEVISHGLPGTGQVRDAVGPMLPGALRALGAELVACDHLPDQPEQLTGAIAQSRAHVVVTVGAASVGPADHLRAVLRALDADLLIGSVAVKPGRPQLLARLPDQRIVVGLPGNPLAALAAICTLVGPLVAGLAGRPLPELALASLTGDVRADPTSTRLVVVRRTADAGAAEPTGHDRAGTLWGAALAQAFAALPPGWDGRSPVPIVPLPG